MMADQFSPDFDNPYAAPASESIDETEAYEESSLNLDLLAFVGKNGTYYLNQWKSVLERRDQKTGFNFAAFLFSGIWLPYRKMYFATFVFYGVVIVESVLQEIILGAVLNRPDISEGIDRVIGLIASIIVGMYANRWYLSHSRRIVDEVRAEHVEDDAVRRILRQRGGTSLLSGFGLFIVFLFVTFTIMIALLMILYPGEF